MNIIRKYKLYRLGIPIDNDCLKIIKFIESNVLNLTEFKDPVYPDFVFYMKGDINMLQYNIKYKEVHVRYEGLCSVFSKQFNLEDTEIQQIIKDIVEEHYKLKVETVYKELIVFVL